MGNRAGNSIDTPWAIVETMGLGNNVNIRYPTKIMSSGQIN